jgi:hypothetical protein
MELLTTVTMYYTFLTDEYGVVNRESIIIITKNMCIYSVTINWTFFREESFDPSCL